MHNYLLDKLPDNYKGYLIRTDFRIGIQIYLLFQEEMKDFDRLMMVAGLLFGKGIPNDYKTLVSALTWFMKCGKEEPEKDEQSETSKEKVFDYDYDSPYVFSAFKKTYNIDISREKMHWFEYNALLKDIDKCALTEVQNIRSKKITPDMSQEEKQFYIKAKKLYQLPKAEEEPTPEEQENFDAFMRSLQEGE